MFAKEPIRISITFFYFIYLTGLIYINGFAE